jgi:hypothetical protein
MAVKQKGKRGWRRFPRGRQRRLSLTDAATLVEAPRYPPAVSHGETTMNRQVTVADLRKRFDRWEEVVKNFERGFLIIKAANDLMYFLERKAYLAALRKAVEGCEDAPIAMVKARQRIRAGEGQKCKNRRSRDRSIRQALEPTKRVCA